MPSHAKAVAVVLLTLSVLCGCARPPADDASNSDPQKLPFDRQPRSTGVSPSQSLIPSSTKLPEGTSLPIRLQNSLSSASSHAGDTFSATIDEPVTIDDQTVIQSGTAVTGRVLEAKPAPRSPESSLEPGYLRIVLVSLNVGGKTIMIETSSIFARGGSRDAPKAKSRQASSSANKDKDIVFGKDRRLNFRLAQTADLQ
jgi:hypothetical protein